MREVDDLGRAGLFSVHDVQRRRGICSQRRSLVWIDSVRDAGGLLVVAQKGNALIFVVAAVC
jgi:hypothetical protein